MSGTARKTLRGFRCIVAGSRTASYKDVVEALALCPFTEKITLVVSGGARGADAHGERLAREHGVKVVRRRAEWRKYGAAAGPRRNRRMAREADALIAIWDGRSPGTRNMIYEARKRGLRVFVHRTTT